MDAPLAQCTREEQRAVVRFLWSEGSSGTKIHQRLLAQYGDNALSKTTVYEWIEKFKTGRTSVKHAEGAGRPSTSTSEEKIEQAQQFLGFKRAYFGGFSGKREYNQQCKLL